MDTTGIIGVDRYQDVGNYDVPSSVLFPQQQSFAQRAGFMPLVQALPKGLLLGFMYLKGHR